MCPFKYYFQVLVLAILPVSIVTQENPNWDRKVEKQLQLDLKSGHVASVFLSFTPTTAELQFAVTHFGPDENREDFADVIWQSLFHLARRDQEQLINMLKEFKYYKVKFESLWLTNRIYIENCNLKLANLILESRNLTWMENDEYPNFQLLQQTEFTRHEDTNTLTWGLQKIEIEKAWKIIGGAKLAGEGALVGIMDTGLNINSGLIIDSWYDEYGWFDPSDNSRRNPTDWDGHGTHVTGTIVGKNGIGVAPGAKFISCRACDSQFGCPRIYIEKCAEEMACPRKRTGYGEGCKKVVDVVNISFGTYKTTSTWFEAIVEAWVAARIIPVVAAGNGGRECKSIYYPGTIKDVLTVGASTKNDGPSEFTSFGPVKGNKYLKPDFVAPGSDIKSASISDVNEYWRSGGSSSAAAHVTGLVAILRGRYEEINLEEVRNIIKLNTDFLHPRLNIKCDNSTDNDKPNYYHGYGRINAHKTVKTLYIKYKK